MSYPGSKGQAGTWHKIIGQMPPHSVYVECFYGSGKVFNEKLAAHRSILIDKNPAVIARVGAAAGVRAIVGDALLELPKLALPADAMVYCDPPYLLSTRQGRLYYGQFEMSDQEHAALLTLLQALKCNVLLSGYPSKLYISQLSNWRCISYRTRVRGSTVTEALWANFPQSEELHDWRFAGFNFRERLYLKRLATRWLRKLDKMAARKRGYVLHAISQRHKWRAPAASAETDAHRAQPELALPMGEVLVKVSECREWKEPVYQAKGYIGSLLVFTSARFTAPLPPMYEAQDWAARQGKTLRFEQDYV